MPAETLAALVDTTGLPGLAVHWVTGPARMATLSRLLVDAAQAVTADEQQHATASPGSAATMTPSRPTATASPSTRKGSAR